MKLSIDDRLAVVRAISIFDQDFGRHPTIDDIRAMTRKPTRILFWTFQRPRRGIDRILRWLMDGGYIVRTFDWREGDWRYAIAADWRDDSAIRGLSDSDIDSPRRGGLD